MIEYIDLNASVRFLKHHPELERYLFYAEKSIKHDLCEKLKDKIPIEFDTTNENKDECVYKGKIKCWIIKAPSNKEEVEKLIIALDNLKSQLEKYL